MYYAGVPTLVVRAKCPALISINGRVAGECGGEGYISVPLSANGDYYVTMQPLLPHDALGAALCPVTRRFSLENGIMEQVGYPDAVLCLWPGGVNEVTMKPIAICAKAGKPCEKAGQKAAGEIKKPANNLERAAAFAEASRRGNYEEAMGYLSPALRRNVTAEAIAEFMGEYGHVRPPVGDMSGDTLGLIYKKKEYVYAARLITIEHGPEGIDNISEL